MLHSAHELGAQEVLRSDFCIAGAGPAGITLALELEKRGTVILLEAGGERVTADSQQFYAGTAQGTILPDNYLSTSRLRSLGGTSGHWAGWCRPFEPDDFKAKPWLHRPAWVVAHSELQEFYSRAVKYVEIPGWKNQENQPRTFPLPFARSADIRARDFQISPPTRFASVYEAKLKQSENIRVIINAKMSDLALSQSGSAIESLAFRGSDGIARSVESKFFVLASGAIENARNLLTMPGIAGHASRLQSLGRGFSDHVETTVGIAVVPSTLLDSKDGVRGTSLFSTTETIRMYFPSISLLQNLKLPNFAVQLTPIPLERCPAEVQEYARVRTELFSQPQNTVHIRLRMEPRISRANGISLVDSVDPFGVPMVALRWELSLEELSDLRTAARAISKELVQQHNAAVHLLLPEDDPWKHAQYASHHIGMTAMSDSISNGVVDGNCRVHGLGNLFIAGSSVFPTAAVASPTLTILALSLRLASHLEALHGRRP